MFSYHEAASLVDTSAFHSPVRFPQKVLDKINSAEDFVFELYIYATIMTFSSLQTPDFSFFVMFP